MAIRIGRDIWLWSPSLPRPLRSEGSHPYTWPPALRIGVSITLAVKTNGDYIQERRMAVGNWVNLGEPVRRLTPSKLHWRCSCLKSTRNKWGETKLTNFSNSLQGWEHWKAPCSFCKPSSHLASMALGDAKSVLSINLAETVYPSLVIP